MFEFGSKELNILFLSIGTVLLLAISLFAEKRTFGTSHLANIFGKEADLSTSKTKLQPWAAIGLIIVVLIPRVYLVWFNPK